MVAVVATRPSLWRTAARTVRRLAAPGWWRRRPFLPLPDADYWRFRLVTAYGDTPPSPVPDEDLLAYLRWCKRSATSLG